MNTAYLAGEDGLELVDLTTLTSERLAALRIEAGAAGDTELVTTIDSMQHKRRKA